MSGKTRTVSLTGSHGRWASMTLLLSVAMATLPFAGCAPLSPSFTGSTVCETFHSWQGLHTTASITDARDAAFWAAQHEQARSEHCVDLYFLAARLSCHDAAHAAAGDSAAEARTTYRESLAGLIRTAQQFGRFDPIQGIRVREGGDVSTLPISYHGFTWEPRDFTRLVIADRFVRTQLKTQHYCEGMGVPLIVVRERETPERFHTSRSHFAATANLKPGELGAGKCEPGWTVELSDPFVVYFTRLEGQPVRLAADYSAPSRYALAREKRTYLVNFLWPNIETAEPKLILLEPYQPGKIPVVFVHGLLSDPLTWVDLYDTIRVDPELQDRYQFWAFRYPTGDAFLRSAADLRRELDAVVTRIDPEGADSALSQMVLVGHSMGGLISQLQITRSEDRLWRSFANRPLESLQGPSQVRARLQELFFFDPSPHIRRVVYIGTPHNGSTMATRSIGRLGSYLVRIPGADEKQYAAFLAANPGVIHRFASRRIPTSVDMLEPNNPILRGLACLPVAEGVATHSIIGTGGWLFGCERSDGVVPVSSARTAGVESELFVDAKHEDLHRHPETIREVLRILHVHLQCQGATDE